MKTTSWPNSARFLAGYFHQDWRQHYGDLDGVAMAVTRRAGGERVSRIVYELEELLGTQTDDAALDEWVEATGAAVDPRALAGSAHEWLQQVQSALKASVAPPGTASDATRSSARQTRT